MSHPNTSPSGASHGSMKSYLIGFYSVRYPHRDPIWMVMEGTATTLNYLMDSRWYGCRTDCCSFSLFLHMNTSSEERWNVIAFLFTLLIIGIVVIGSLWIMYNLNINMMMD